MKTSKKPSNNIRQRNRLKRLLSPRALIFIIFFAAIGAILLFRSYASSNPITYWRWCPKDGYNCHMNWTPQTIMDRTWAIYHNNGMNLVVKAPKDMVNVGVHYSNHYSLWYLAPHTGAPEYISYPIMEFLKYNYACDPRSRPDCKGGLPLTWPAGYPGAYVMDNIRWEIEHQLKWSWDRPRVIITGFNTGNNGMSNHPGSAGGCGISTTPLDGASDGNNIRRYKLGFVWGAYCNETMGWNEDRLGVAAAHELGHILAGLPHVIDSNYLMNANSSCAWQTCRIYPDERNALIVYNSGLVYPN